MSFCRVVLSLALLVASSQAHAHTAIPGLSGFQGGLLHPVLVLDHVITLIAIGLLIGQQIKSHRCILAVGLVAGFACAIGFIVMAVPADSGLIVLMIAFLAGLLGALGRPLSLSVTLPLVTIGNAAIALDSVPSVVSSKETLLALLGTSFSATLMMLLIASGTAAIQKRPLRIGGRIVASWAAATALLVLATRLR